MLMIVFEISLEENIRQRCYTWLKRHQQKEKKKKLLIMPNS